VVTRKRSDYSYLSKLENEEIGPCEKPIERIAEHFEYDRAKLMLSAGKVPQEIVQILQSHPDEAIRMGSALRTVPNDQYRESYLRIIESQPLIDGRFENPKRIDPLGGGELAPFDTLIWPHPTENELIVIDEMAYVAMPEAAAELLFQIISGRAERAAMIVTTNLPFSEWTTMFPNARSCKAMLDRLTDQAHIIETGTESYRISSGTLTSVFVSV
jgi:hypothetical protein